MAIRTSITDQVREHFQANAGQHFDRDSLARALDQDPQQISNALFLLYKSGEIQREKKTSGAGYTYWLDGTPTNPKPDQPRAAHKPDGDARPRKTRAPRETPAAATDTPDPADSMFAIQGDGTLGINTGDEKVSLKKPQVQRLQAFLNVTAKLWA